MGRIADILAETRTAERGALMPFLTAGYPDLAGHRTHPLEHRTGVGGHH